MQLLPSVEYKSLVDVMAGSKLFSGFQPWLCDRNNLALCWVLLGIDTICLSRLQDSRTMKGIFVTDLSSLSATNDGESDWLVGMRLATCHVFGMWDQGVFG